MLPPIIFIGFPRSGTTIISEIIFQHEDLALISNYQEALPGNVTINIVRRFFENSFWRIMGNKRLKNLPSKLNYFLFRPLEGYKFWERISGKDINFTYDFLFHKKAQPKDAIRIRNYFSKLMRLQGKKRLAFKITGPGRLTYLHSIFPEAIFINIVRDPVATMRSLLEVDFWQGDKQHKLWWTGAYSTAELEACEALKTDPRLLAAFQYKKVTETILEEAEDTNANLYNIRYEDFVKAPQDEIMKLMDYTNLRQSKYVNDYMQLINITNQNQKRKSKVSIPDDIQEKIREIVQNSK